VNILGLDLGTNCGYAYNVEGTFAVGTWVLGTDKEIKQWGKTRLTRRRDPRIERFCQLLGNLPPFDVLVFEDVQFASYTLQVQLWSALRATAWLCGTAKIWEAVPVSTLKAFATGSGAADKEHMATKLEKFYPKLWQPGLDDDAIDAIWLWLWAKKTLTREKL